MGSNKSISYKVYYVNFRKSKGFQLKESKSEAPAWICFGVGFLGYTIFMFFLLSERKSGIHYFEDLAMFNKSLLYSISFLLIAFSMSKKRFFTNKYGESPLWVHTYIAPFVFLLLGLLFPAMFFMIIT